jgi:hypothetical protein
LGWCAGAPAAELGEDDDELVLTEVGEAFYRDFALDQLPAVRGYNWHMRASKRIEPAVQQLTHRWAARAATSEPA